MDLSELVPVTHETKCAMGWYVGLTQATRYSFNREAREAMDRATQYYGKFLTTGEKKYFNMAQDFLDWAQEASPNEDF